MPTSSHQRWDEFLDLLVGARNRGAELITYTVEREVMHMPPDPGSPFIKKIPGPGLSISVDLWDPIKPQE